MITRYGHVATGTIESKRVQYSDMIERSGAMRFNPPPGWPPAPDNWRPPLGWEPPQSWPPVPRGWALWIEDPQADAPETADPSDPSDPSGAASHSIGLTPSTNRLILAASVAVFMLGAYEVIFKKSDSGLAASLFTVIPAGIAILQLFTLFPVLPIARNAFKSVHAERGEAASRTLRPESSLPTTDRQFLQIPLVYGIAFFVSAIFTALGVSRLLAAGDSPTAPSINDFVITLVAANSLYIFGLPGFHAFQKSTAGDLASLLGCACGATGAIFGTLSIWVYADALNQGLQTPPSFHELGLVGNWTAILADLLLTYAIIKANVYPRWTAAMMFINATLLYLFLTGGKSMVLIYRVDLLVDTFPQAVIAWYMTRMRSFG
jgi:hypothetical protein